MAEEAGYEPPPAPLMPRPFIDGVSDHGPLPSGAAFNEAAEAANDFGGTVGPRYNGNGFKGQNIQSQWNLSLMILSLYKNDPDT